MDEHDEDKEDLSVQGVRIIGAEEAAAALEAGASGRKAEDEPRFGDVPRTPEGPRPAHRFPRGDEAPDPAAARQGGDADPRSARSFDQDEADALEPHRTGQIPELPHWTDPPTGEVPSVLSSGNEPEDDLDAWATLPGRGPGWRDEQTDWDDGDYQPSMLADDDTRVGALDEREGPDPYSLDAVDTLDSEPATTAWDEPPQAPPPPSRAARARQRSRTSGALRRAGGRETRNVPIAVGTGVLAGLIAIALFKLGPVTSLILSLVLVCLAAAEAYAVLRRAGYRPATLLGLVATAAIMVAAYWKGEVAIPLVVALTIVFTLLWYLAGVVRARPTINAAVTLVAFMWVGVLGSFAGLLLDPKAFPLRHGVAYLVGAVIATIAYDIGGYAFGSLIGRHQLAPQISPNKTWEGLIGGMAAAFFVAVVVVSQIHPWSFKHAAALGLVVAVAAPLGDLCESMIKRDIGVKDMGSILPGHGGVLDRVDAILFVLPATYYLVQLLKLG